MDNKIGRNDPCPCGSGKKYKKCCLLEAQQTADKSITKYSKYEIIKYLASLLLIPKNQSKQLRIERAIYNALLMDFSNRDNISYDRTMIDINDFAPVDYWEDPVDNLFSQIVMFHGGNYIVYPGISSASVNQLQIALDTINHIKDDIDEPIMDEILQSVYFILNLSNNIAKRLSHSRYMATEQDLHQSLRGFNTQNELHTYISSITFSIDDVKKISKINNDILGNFVVTREDIPLTDYNAEECIFINKPIILTETELIVLFPSLLVDALRYQVLSSITKCIDYRKFITLTITQQTTVAYNEFDKKGFKHIGTEFILDSDVYLYTIRVYQIDSDKYLSHILLSNCITYDTMDFFSNIVDYQPDKTIIEAQTRTYDIIRKEDATLEEDNVVFLITSMSFGFTFYQAIKEALIIESNDLYLLLRDEDFNVLSLWKYKKAINLLPTVNPGLSFFVLWSTYINNNESFYLTDDGTPTDIFFDYGQGSDYRANLHRKFDLHLEKDTTNKLVKVIKHSVDYDNSIYFKLERPFDGHYLMVGGYSIPVWITISTKNNYNELVSIIAQSIAYWLWRMTESLSSLIDSSSFSFIKIQLSVPDAEKWFSDEVINFDEEKGIATGIDCNKITMEITRFSKPIFMRADNSGDKFIMRYLIMALLEVLELNSPEIEEVFDSMYKTFFENSQAKMIHLALSNDVYAVPIEVPWVHKIHDADVDLILHGIAKKIGFSFDFLDETQNRKAKYRMFLQTIEYFEKLLDEKLQSADIENLLLSLMQSNEAYIFVKTKKTWLSSSIITTYPEYANKIKKEVQIIDGTSSVIRFLIEFSMHTKGADNKLSNDSIEELLAICHHIIGFGYKFDAFKADLWSIDISPLSTGRIGIKEDAKGYNDFIKSKQTSQFEYYARTYKYDYEKAASDYYDEDYNKAIEAEYGLKDSVIQKIIKYLASIASADPSGVLCISRKGLITKVITNIGQITEKEVLSFFTMFTLEQRNHWSEIPEGYDEKDILPWEFKRKLAMVLKPIIAHDDNLLFGVKSLYQSNNYLFMGIHLGRLNASYFKSTEMKALTNRIENKLSDDFVQHIKDQISIMHPTWFLDKNVDINKNGKIYIPKDLALGDIDVLAVDYEQNILYSIECKRINFGRTSTEIRNERKRFVEGSGNKLSWVSKHKNRHQWLQDNKCTVKASLKLPRADFSVESLVVVSEDIALRYLNTPDLRILTESELLSLIATNTN